MLNQHNVYSDSRALSISNSYFQKVYLWMTIGLLTTTAAAFFMLTSASLQQMIFGNRMAFYGLMIAEFGLVIFMTAAINRISSATATLMFLGYSALNGITFSAIFLVYTQSSIVSTFLVTAGTFAAMSMYGYATKRDLTGFGSFLFMGLIGIVIASLVNMFLHNQMIYWITSYLGVFIFVGLTAYDTQKIKRIGQAGFASEQHYKKAAILGALTLYLDFINLFLMLLRIMGNRR